jgi:hypothetical protein
VSLRLFVCSSLATIQLLSAAKVADKTMSNGSSYQKAGGAAYQPISVNGEGAPHWTQMATNGGRGLLVTHSTLVSVYTDIDDTGNGNSKKKILIGIAVVAAIVGISCAAIFGGGNRKSSMDQAIKSTGLNVTSSGKLKLFDGHSKFDFLSI